MGSNQNSTAGKRRLTPSLRKILAGMLAVLLPIVAVGIGFVAYSVQSTQEKEAQRFREAVEGQAQAASESLVRMNYYLIDLLLNSPHIRALEEAADTNGRNVATRELFAAISNEAQLWAWDYSFYFQSEVSGLASAVYNYSIPMASNNAVRAHIHNQVASGMPEGDALNWAYVVEDGRAYLYQLYQLNGHTLGAWVACDALFGGIRANTLNEGALLTYLDMEGSPLLGEAALEGIDFADGKAQPTRRGTVLQLAPSRTGIQVLVADEPYIDWGGVFLLLSFLLLILLFVLGVAVYVLLYYRRHIEAPMAEFRRHIGDFATSRESARRGGFQELNDAVAAFDSLVGELEELRIDLYEEKLSLAQTELEYYQLQIKPHFFVNSFSLIHAMAQKKEYARIQEFCIKLSGYVRYLLSNGMRLVPLEEELHMVREYLDIQRIRHRVEATLLDSVDSGLCAQSIPPLTILTFVENSVRHGKGGGEDITVHVNVHAVARDEGPRLHIEVLDDGVGFPQDFLEMHNVRHELREDTPADSHLGVRNIQMRLALLYGENHRLAFDNPPEGGSRVTVEIPMAQHGVREEPTP